MGYQEQSSISKCVIEGPSNITLLRTTKSNSLANVETSSENSVDIKEMDLIHKKYDKEINFDGKDILPITEIIKKEVKSDFKLEDFEYYISNNGGNNYTISLIYKINDIYTDRGCNVVIEDNKITDIFNNISDNDLKIYDNEISKLNKISNDKQVTLKNIASRKINLNDDSINITRQEIKKFFDTYTKTEKISVLSVYEKNNQEYTASYDEIL